MLAAYRRERILILGGGDGLALRDVLRWEPRSVTLVDIDSARCCALFRRRGFAEAPAWLGQDAGRS